MLNKEEIKRQFEGKTEEEALKILAEQYQISLPGQTVSCKFWFAEVFTYCSAKQLEYKSDCRQLTTPFWCD